MYQWNDNMQGVASLNIGDLLRFQLVVSALKWFAAFSACGITNALKDGTTFINLSQASAIKLNDIRNLPSLWKE